MPDDLDIALTGAVAVAIYPPGATFGPRRMRDFEFVWMIQGDAAYTYERTTVAAPEGSVVLCRPGRSDGFQWDTRRPTHHGYFHFAIRQTPEEWPAMEQWPAVRELREDDVIRPLFRHLLTWQGRGSARMTELAVKGILTAFVTGETAAGDVRLDALPDAVDLAWRHLHQRLEADPAAAVPLAELADAACVTSEHLCRLFKRATGNTPARTVMLARLDRAAGMLARTNMGIGQIAELCGFAGPFHFSRRFKAAFGRSPGQVRQAIRDGETPPLPRLLRRFQRG